MLEGKRIAIIATDGYHNTELSDPMNALKEKGANVTVIGVNPEHITEGMLDHMSVKNPHLLPPEKRLKADNLIGNVSSNDFDALLIPGGYAPEKLRIISEIISFVQDIYLLDKPIGAICHGPQVLISAGITRGKKMTCVGTIADDLKNSGAIYFDRPLVVDDSLVTSRTPKDMEFFIEGFISVLSNN